MILFDKRPFQKKNVKIYCMYFLTLNLNTLITVKLFSDINFIPKIKVYRVMLTIFLIVFKTEVSVNQYTVIRGYDGDMIRLRSLSIILFLFVYFFPQFLFHTFTLPI